MRYLFPAVMVAVLSGVAGCASPGKTGTSYYAGVHTPGQIKVASDGSFVSDASVESGRNPEYGRKAAFARLLIAAREGKYTHYSLSDDGISAGGEVRLEGQLYRSDPPDNSSPVDSIRIMLAQPVLPEKKVSAIPLAAPTASAPVSANASTGKADEDGPVVILAPDDITGSIERTDEPAAESTDARAASAARNILLGKPAPVKRRIITSRRDLSSVAEETQPESTDAIPSGVMVRTY